MAELADEQLELKLDEEQTVHMRVSTQIIEHLSKGIYTNAARSIKELIINAYDADATEVSVRALPELDMLSIEDNGIGMNYTDFSRNFLIISRSNKRDQGLFSPICGRPLVGKIGIGFVAVSQICDEMVVISSKKGEDFKFQAEIDFGKFRKTAHKNKEFYELSEVKLTNSFEELNAHYTIVILRKLTSGFRKQLQDKDIKEAHVKTLNLDGLPYEKIFNLIRKRAIAQGSGFDLGKNIGKYWQIMLEVAETVPVPYMNSGPIHIAFNEFADFVKKISFQEKKPNIRALQESENGISILNEIRDDVKKLNFNVNFDGISLRKPILFPIDPSFNKIGEDFDVFTFKETIPFEDQTKLCFHGYIYNQKKSIYPPQFRGLIIRIKNTAIGGPDPNFLEYLFGDKLFFNWTFGEVYVSDGLEDAMNINRSSFMTSHEHYQALRSYIHKILHTVVFPRARERYDTRLSLEKDQEDKQRINRLCKYLRITFDKEFQIEWVENKSRSPVLFNFEKGRVDINIANPLFRKLSKTERSRLESLLVYIYAAYHFSRGDSEKMLDKLLTALKEWKHE